MKLLFENWRKYLNEEEPPKEVGKPTPAQADLVRDFIKKLAVIAQASDDLAGELEEGTTSAGRAAKRGRSRRRQHTKLIKDRAGLVGVKLADFTPEQKQLYDQTKKSLRTAPAEAQHAFLATLAGGNMLKLPMIRHMLRGKNNPLRIALSVVAPDCLVGPQRRQAERAGAPLRLTPAMRTGRVDYEAAVLNRLRNFRNAPEVPSDNLQLNLTCLTHGLHTLFTR